ncbi:subclass B1 metallo-beta-lactamase [Flavisolibacter sp. BT320]|nr:subclass B1 metallo-beta-lactamase [Flavisolibacter longurius]
MKHFLLFSVALLHYFLLSAQQTEKITENLSIVSLSQHAYLHIGMLETTSFGRVGCNGLVYIRNGEAVVMDTPPDTAQSRALLGWIEKRFPGTKVKAVIVNHFHDDCLAGLPVFHEKGIASYANVLTIALAREKGVPVPLHAFTGRWELAVGGENIRSGFYGEAHTKDNIISWIPSEKILFGGCQVKSLGSAKGNLADANVDAWSETASKIKAAYKNARIVVPGHGDVGTTALLDYTIDLFSPAAKQ